MSNELSEQHREVLDFEAKWGTRHTGPKASAIWTTFRFSPTRYYQLLITVMESPAAAAAEPQLVARLQRVRAQRVERRSAEYIAQHGFRTV